MHFLMKLDKQYNQVHTNLLMLQDLPSIQDVYRMLLLEECHRKLSTDHLPIEPMAFGAVKWRTAINGGSQKYSPRYKNKPLEVQENLNIFVTTAKFMGTLLIDALKFMGTPTNLNLSLGNKMLIETMMQALPWNPLLI